VRLVNPVRGSVVTTTDPRTITYLRYGRGYWVINDEHTASAEPPVEQQPEASDVTRAEPAWDDDLQTGPVPE
jgi:hypothetical protein